MCPGSCLLQAPGNCNLAHPRRSSAHREHHLHLLSNTVAPHHRRQLVTILQYSKEGM